MTASDIASYAALILSGVSIYITSKFNTRQNELADTTERLNKMLIDREKAEGLAAKKADLSANLIQVGKSNYRLKVFNRGKGVARNVRLIDLENPNDTFLMANDISNRFPVPILEYQQAVELIAAIHMGSPLRAHIKLIWDDETGTDHEKELTPAL
jgi:Tfp pilus assembly pilus retraction ATPase PilT